MEKHRLELFSDGVFAIALTLLVLDIKTPEEDHMAGLLALAPGLLVHALAFFAVGMHWVLHHHSLDTFKTIKARTLYLNLLMLFWITLLPLGAKIAGDHPTGSLGAMVLAGSSALSGLTLILVGASTEHTAEDLPELGPWLRRRRAILLAYYLLGLLAAGLSWISPWFGYAYICSFVIGFFVEPPARVEQRLRDPAE
jgi:uncharacterized membrane protein